MTAFQFDAQVHPDAFAALEELVFPDLWSASSFSDGPDRLSSSVWLGMTCLGYCYGQQVLDEVELWRIAIHPEWRRRGLARQLLDHWIARCRIRSATQIFLEVAGPNASALGLYHQAGFVESGRRRAYYHDGTDAVLMVRRL